MRPLRAVSGRKRGVWTVIRGLPPIKRDKNVMWPIGRCLKFKHRRWFIYTEDREVDEKLHRLPGIRWMGEYFQHKKRLANQYVLDARNKDTLECVKRLADWKVISFRVANPS